MHLPKVLITTAMAVAMMMIPPSIDAQPVNTIVTMQESDMYNIYKEEYMDDAAQGSSITKIKTLLVNHAKDSQKYVVRLLSKHPDVQYHSFWISNQLVVLNASPELVKELQKTRHVQEVRQEEILPLPSYPVPPSQVSAFNGNQTTFANIQVSEAWANGFTGKNIVVGSIGSGVRYTHKSLRSNFHKRFGWLDPLQHSTVPTDSHGISTHAVGLMVGRDGTGVAPDAQWMACKACQDDGCHESHLLECAQFMTCPTNTNGENPDCHQGASVIHNAWTGSSTQATFYRNVFRLWKYVSKTPVFAAGDKGSECSTIGTIESTPNGLTVGAATDQYKLAPFSSRGTSQVHMYEVKPDLIAPGINLISVAHDSDQGLVQVTGTQAASAVAAGSLLLLLSQRPSLSNPDVRQIFMTNSVAWKSNEDEMEGGNDCGAPSDANSNGYPNANMGWGNLNLHLALDVLRVKSTVPDCRILGREECLSRKNDCDWYWRENRCAWKQYVPPFTAYCNALPHKMCIYTRLCYFSSDDDICYPLVGA